MGWEWAGVHGQTCTLAGAACPGLSLEEDGGQVWGKAGQWRGETLPGDLHSINAHHLFIFMLL